MAPSGVPVVTEPTLSDGAAADERLLSRRRVRGAVIGRSLWSPSLTLGEPMLSYSQNAEDVRLWRVFRTIENGFYVDVGAADPNVDSVTRLFYEHGWSGINIEPSPCFDALSEARTRDVNLRVAVGESEDVVPFFLTYPYLGMSTVDPSVHAAVTDLVERIEESTIPQRRLDSILREHAGDRTIHFLKVDVEGAERQVLASSDWDSFRPIVVIVEAIESCSTTTTHENWESVLVDAGYRFAAFDGINRVYVDQAHDRLIPALAYPVSALDRFVTPSSDTSETKLQQALAELREQTAETESLRARLDRAEAELARARHALDVVHGSQTWRAGRIVARTAGPFLAASKRLRGWRSN
jgi:FkbM family methyltransferase